MWWDKVARNIADLKFAKMVDELLENVSPNEIYDSMGTWDAGLE